MTNRVDDLESEIAELRAAVNGLTEELVETKARVRELETEAEAEAEDDGFVDADPVRIGDSRDDQKRRPRRGRRTGAERRVRSVVTRSR